MKKNKLRVGIDVDGVMRDFVGGIIDKYKEETGLNIPREGMKWNFMYEYTVNGSTLAQKVWATGEWLEPAFVDSKHLSDAIEGYNMFVSDPELEVYVVSAQSKGTEYLTDLWLEKQGMTKHKKTIYTFDKTESPCQVLIDDKIENLLEFEALSRMAVCIKQPWNEHKQFKHTTNSLKEAYNLIKTL